MVVLVVMVMIMVIVIVMVMIRYMVMVVVMVKSYNLIFITHLRSVKSISVLSPDINLCSSGPENHDNHSGFIMDLKPRLNALVWSRICWYSL